MLLWLLGCTQQSVPIHDEQSAIADYLAVPLAVSGTVIDPDSRPIAGALVKLGAHSARTDDGGRFTLSGVARQNAWLRIDAPAHRLAERPLFLMEPLGIETVELGRMGLQAAADDNTRFTFFGDTMFGRRFLDPSATAGRADVPRPDASALIAVDAPLAGSRQILAEMGPWLEEPDVTVVNLESPVLTEPDTPHPLKPYVFFTLPESLDALTEAGVDYVSLGNNHVYDYLEAGTADTLRLVADAGLAQSGAGMNLDEAYAPWWVDAPTHSYALVSASSIDGRKWDLHYNAEPDKGGAADLVDEDAFFRTMDLVTLSGGTAIAQLHMGNEYTFAPTEAVRAHVERARDAGAALVIGHHPHTAQGFSWDGSTLAAYSLGNFVFDSDRLETLLAVGLRADLRGDQLVDAHALPIYVEDYSPRAAVGPAGQRLLRRLGETSAPDGVWVVPDGGLGWLARSEDDIELMERTVEVDVVVGSDRRAFVDLREHKRPSESLISAQLDAPLAQATPGRDLLVFGDLEDVDVDGDWGEATRWDTERDSVTTCMNARRGVRALCSVRDYTNLDPSVIALRQRVRVLGDAENAPNKDLSLVLYSEGRSAGAARAYVRWMASEGEAEFGEPTVWRRDGGSWDWSRTVVPLQMPEDLVNMDAPETNPRALRLFVSHDPPRERVEGMLTIDDVAIVSWDDDTLLLDGQDTRGAPNAWEFLELDAPPGEHRLSLVLAELRRRS